MRIEENILVVDEPILEDKIDEFEVSVKQPQIEKIIVENDDVHSNALQILWCLDKNIEIKSDFLEKFFENVKVVD